MADIVRIVLHVEDLGRKLPTHNRSGRRLLHLPFMDETFDDGVAGKGDFVRRAGPGDLAFVQQHDLIGDFDRGVDIGGDG